MTEFKSAWDITQDLHNLLYDTEKPDNEIYNKVFEISKIFAEVFIPYNTRRFRSVVYGSENRNPK